MQGRVHHAVDHQALACSNVAEEGIPTGMSSVPVSTSLVCWSAEPAAATGCDSSAPLRGSNGIGAVTPGGLVSGVGLRTLRKSSVHCTNGPPPSNELEKIVMLPSFQFSR